MCYTGQLCVTQGTGKNLTPPVIQVYFLRLPTQFDIKIQTQIRVINALFVSLFCLVLV